MTRTCVKCFVAAGLMAGLVLSTSGVALPAKRPPVSNDPNAHHPWVLFINQARIDAQGLTAKEAIARANRYEPYHVSTPHYIPKGFQLVMVRVFPYIPNQQEPSDTQTFYLVSAIKPHASNVRLDVPNFEVDHRFGQPFSYVATGQLTTARAGKYTVSIAEQQGTKLKTHKRVDLLYVYWYDKKTKVATEVTTDLQTSTLKRADVLKIVASLS